MSYDTCSSWYFIVAARHVLFFRQSDREPVGDHFVQICTTTPCMLRGSTDVLNTVCQHLGGIKPGETTKDGKFTVIEVECQGACSNAPMMVVGDDYYVRVSLYSLVRACVQSGLSTSFCCSGGPYA